MKTIKLLAIALPLILLMACSSTPKKTEEENRKAAETNTSLGQEYMRRDQLEIALEKLKRAVAYDETYAPAHTLLATLYETVGEDKRAEEEYRLAVQYDPKGGDVNNNLGAFLCSRGHQREAETHFVTAVKDPFYDTPEIALANAGSCALSSGDLDKAESFLRQSLEYDHKLGTALLPMAEVSYQRGSYMRARAFLQRYESVGPETEESLGLGYRIESGMGDEESANRYRDELLRQYPGSTQAGRMTGREEE